MAVCNIFNSLSKNTGTFLTFSQYAESMTDTTKKVVPSKFVAININNAKIDLSNSSIPKTLQDYYENGVAVIKNKGEWKYKYSKDLFWRTMFDHFIENEDIKYIGDINIQSYEEYGGTGYSEIYCYVPNEAGELECELVPNSTTKTIDTRNKGAHLEGYENQIDTWYNIEQNIDYKVTNENSTDDIDGVTNNWYDNLKGIYKNTDDAYYTFNTIVVLYDVVDIQNNEIIRNNLPMGIYFTGSYDEPAQELTNYVTKYISSPEIYGQGTSYGLRICTKHITGSVSSIINEPIINEHQISNDTKSELCYALTQMSQSQTKMDEVIDHTYNCVQNYKDLAAVFKNSKTNVPYIKLINGKEYWFVNGRRVGTATIDDGELEHVCGINIDVKIYDKNNSEIKVVSIEDLFKADQKIYIKWTIKNGDVLLQHNEINNIKLTLPNEDQEKLSKTSEGQYEYTIQQYGSKSEQTEQNKNTLYHQIKENFIITVTLADRQEVSKDFGYIITFPSYIGLIRDDVPWGNYLMNINNEVYKGKLNELLTTKDYWGAEPTKLLLENQVCTYNYTNKGYEVSYTDNAAQPQNTNAPYHVCYIYPAIKPNNIDNIKNGLSNITEYKLLTSIKDSKDLEYINDFTKVTPEYIGDETGSLYPYIIGRFGNEYGSSVVLYNVYIDEIPAFVNNYTLTFK